MSTVATDVIQNLSSAMQEVGKGIVIAGEWIGHRVVWLKDSVVRALPIMASVISSACGAIALTLSLHAHEIICVGSGLLVGVVVGVAITLLFPGDWFSSACEKVGNLFSKPAGTQRTASNISSISTSNNESKVPESGEITNTHSSSIDNNSSASS